MVNWRKHLMRTVWHIKNRSAGRHFRQFAASEFESPDVLRRIQEERLRSLLRHAAQNVPYYGRILAHCGAVKDGVVSLDRFSSIPLLTKAIIRREGSAMHSRDSAGRRPFINSSGGSTGEPVSIVQDYSYSEWAFAVERYLFSLCGIDVGEPNSYFGKGPHPPDAERQTPLRFQRNPTLTCSVS